MSSGGVSGEEVDGTSGCGERARCARGLDLTGACSSARRPVGFVVELSVVRSITYNFAGQTSAFNLHLRHTICRLLPILLVARIRPQGRLIRLCGARGELDRSARLERGAVVDRVRLMSLLQSSRRVPSRVLSQAEKVELCTFILAGAEIRTCADEVSHHFSLLLDLLALY